MFSWEGSSVKSASTKARPEEYPSSISKYAEQDEVYDTTLPPTLPVVKETIDSLAALAAKQRMFVAMHADKIKLELVKERVNANVPIGEWRLNGFALSDEDAVDFVRQSPDSLSNMTYIAYKDTSLWTKLTSWLNFGNTDRDAPNALNLADDLGFVLAVSECVELTGNVLGVVSQALTTQAPRVGKPLRRQLAFELTRSDHRGSSHSMYLLANVVHATQNAASSRKASTLKVDLSLYIYQPRFLGGISGVAVNISGQKADDLPMADIEAAELRRLLAKKGTFVASAVSDFVLDPREETTSERAARITILSSEKLINSANGALSSFFELEASRFESDREAMRRRIAEERARIQLEAELAAQEEAQKEEERRSRDEFARQQQQQQLRDPSFGQYGVYTDRDPADMVESGYY
jgi:hypothetical protein